jgi:tRNA threonylcarbamoyladenosine biosynthesis protein TsaB
MADEAKLIAVETSGRVGGVALAEGGRLVHEQTITAGMRHGRELVPALDAALKRAGWSPGDVGVVAVSIGPGSFTGLRIAVMFARALAWHTGARVVAVPTLRAVAEQAPADALRVAAVTDAQRGGVYWAVYGRAKGGSLERERAEAVGPPEEVVRAAPAGALATGDGLERYAELFAGRPQADRRQWAPRARTVAALGWAMHRRGEHTAADLLEPLYVRRPAPEEVRDRRARGGR